MRLWGLWLLVMGGAVWAGDADLTDEQKIRALNQTYLATLKAGDLDGHLALFCDDAEVYFPGQAPLFGAEAIKYARAENLRLVRLVNGAIHTDRLDIDGGTAYARGRFSYTLQRLDQDRKTWSYSGLFVLILKKQADGSWRIKVDGGFPSPE